jgi:uncharacterized repeat protein (TIGR01451 family)
MGRTVLLLVALLATAAAALSQSFAPVPWPSEPTYRAYTSLGTPMSDYYIKDPSNGGASPQGYVNIASGIPDLSLPSVYYSFDGTNVFVRFRLESNAVSYVGGATGSNVDPWSSAQWVMIIDLNGDGFRDFAVFLDGASGSPSQPIDVIKIIYSNLTTTQSIDYSQPGIHLVSQMFAAAKYTSGPFTGQLRQYDGSANLVTVNAWPDKRNTKTYDFGTSRGIISPTSAGQYFLEFQMPLASFDARPFGGPQMLPNTPFAVSFCTASSLNDPFQKDIAYQGAFRSTPSGPIPIGDMVTFGGGTVGFPVITSVTASACPNTILTTLIRDALTVLPDGVTVVSTVNSVNFSYWYDANANGLADEAGGAWILLGAGTPGPLGTWKRNWNTSSLPKGQYLVKVVATNQLGRTTDSYTQNLAGFGTVIATLNNICGTSFPALAKSVSPSSVPAEGSAAQRTVAYTITVTNPSASPATITSITDALPSTFTYVADSGGTITPATSPSGGASGSITWTFSPPATVPGSGSVNLIFKARAGTAPGSYANSVSAVGSVPLVAASNVARVTVTEASAVVQKTASSTGALTPGQAFSYTLAYTNNGTATLNLATLVDTLSSALTFVSATGGGTYNPANRVVTWSLGSLTPGQSGSVTLNVSVVTPYAGPSSVSNRASLSATELVTPAGSNTAVNAVSAPVLSFTKSANLASALPGNALTYTLTYTNSGPGAATGVTVTDTLPAELTYVTGTSFPGSIPLVVGSTGGSPNRQILTWTVGSVAGSGTTGSISFQALVASPYPSVGANQPMANTAVLTTAESAPVTAASTVLVTANPNLSVTKTSNAVMYAAGDTATFTVTLSNTGNAAATISSIQDSLPAGFTYVSTGGGSLSPTSSPSNGSSGTVTWSFAPNATIGSGASATLVFKSKVSASNGIFTNTARATGSVQGSGSSSVSGSVIVSVSSGNEFILKSVNRATATVGDTLTYTLIYRNNSGGNQPSREAWDTLTASLGYVAGSQTAVSSDGDPVTFSQVGSALHWAFGNPYRNNTFTTITFKAVVLSAGMISNTGWSMRGTTPLQPSNVVQVNVQPAPNMTLTKSVNKTSVPVNGVLTYTIAYSNAGGAGTASNVVIADSIPANLTYVTGSATGGGAFSASPAPRGRLTWALGSLPGGAGGSFTFQATVDGATPLATVITNRAWMTNGENQAKSSSVNDTVKGLPAFSFTKSVNLTAAGPGDTLVYTLAYQNTGSASANATTITDNIPAGTTFVAASGGGTLGGSTVTWNIGTLAAGASGSRTLSVRVNGPVAPGSITQVSNSASVACTEIGATASNTVATPISYPAVALNKTADNASTTPGSTLTYTIVVSNGSGISATGAVLYDSIPANTTYLANSTTLNGSPAADVSGASPLVAGLALGTITSSQPATVTFSVVVVSPLANGVKISNGARTTNTRETGVIRSNTVVTNVVSSPVLSLSKSSALGGTAVPGVLITYTVTYGNSGTTTADAVNIDDPIPANTRYVAGSVTGTGASFDAFENRIVVTRPSINAGVSGLTFGFQVQVESPLPQGTTTITNTATASASNAPTVNASASDDIVASSSFTLSKSAPVVTILHGAPTPADTLTFTVGYAFNGSAIDDSVFLNDTIPSGMTYLSSTLHGLPSGSAVGQVVSWNIGLITPGSTGLATITVRTTTPGVYENTATMTSRHDPVGTRSNTVQTEVLGPNSGVIDQTPSILPGADVVVTVTDIDLKGQGLIFVQTVNSRTGEIEQLGLSETGLNTGVFTASLSTGFGTASGTPNDGQMLVQAGDSVVSLYVDAVNAAGIEADVRAFTLVIGGVTGTVAVAPPSTAPGNPFVWTITDGDLNHNAGTAESYQYEITSATGEHELLTLTETGVATGVFTGTLATLSGATPGANDDGTMTVQPGNVLSVVYYDTLNALGTNDTASTSAVVGTVTLTTSTKHVTDINGGPAAPADTVSYALIVRNTGNVTATSVAVTDTIPAFLTVVPGSMSSGALASGVLTFAPFDLAAGDSTILSFRATIDTTVPDLADIRNVALIAANGASHLVSASFTASNRPVMVMAKSADRPTPLPGDTVLYTITFSNTGTGIATNVVLLDSIPLHTAYIPQSVTLDGAPQTDEADADGVTVDAQAIQVTITGEIRPGQGGTVRFKVRVQ